MATPSDYEKKSHRVSVDRAKAESDYAKTSFRKQKAVRGDGPPPASEG